MISVCRANAHRARQYMLAYIALADAESEKNPQIINDTNTNSNTDSSSNNTGSKKSIKVTHSLIEKCVSMFRKRRTH